MVDLPFYQSEKRKSRVQPGVKGLGTLTRAPERCPVRHSPPLPQSWSGYQQMTGKACMQVSL